MSKCLINVSLFKVIYVYDIWIKGYQEVNINSNMRARYLHRRVTIDFDGKYCPLSISVYLLTFSNNFIPRVFLPFLNHQLTRKKMQFYKLDQCNFGTYQFPACFYFYQNINFVLLEVLNTLDIKSFLQCLYDADL